MTARFEDRLLNVDVLKEPVDGKYFRSTHTFDYTDETGEVYPIPANVNTDFGTVPRGLRWFVPRIGKYNYACYLHDWLCEYKIVSRKKADELFREAMKVCGLKKIKRGIRYFGVRIYSILTFKK